MKKNILARRILVSMAAVAVITTSVFAAESLQEKQMASEKTEISETEKEEQDMNFVVHSGVVESAESYDDDSVRVQISNENMGLVAAINKDTIILQGGEYKKLEDIKAGMEITFIIPSNAPMGLSMPPFTGSVAVAVLKDENTSFDFSKYDENLVSESSKLQLNIGEDTNITNSNGARKRFTADDVKNTESIVFYTIATKSIPAQTNPKMIMIMSENENADSDSIEFEYVPLRDTAENAGFEVVWTSNDAPVIIKNNDVEIALKIGESEIDVNGEKLQLSLETKLDDGKIVVSSELSNILGNK